MVLLLDLDDQITWDHVRKLLTHGLKSQLGAISRSLVERFDAVKFGVFKRKSVNFLGLVLFCVEADFCNQILIF